MPAKDACERLTGVLGLGSPFFLRPARNIARQRRQLKITQKEMARLLSLTTETVCRLEKGRHDFSLRRLQQFADIFSCRVIDLLR